MITTVISQDYMDNNRKPVKYTTYRMEKHSYNCIVLYTSNWKQYVYIYDDNGAYTYYRSTMGTGWIEQGEYWVLRSLTVENCVCRISQWVTKKNISPCVLLFKKKKFITTVDELFSMDWCTWSNYQTSPSMLCLIKILK